MHFNYQVILINEWNLDFSNISQVIQESELDGKPTFKIYLFLTPQCQYEETALGDIVINNASAVAIMHVATGKSPSIDLLMLNFGSKFWIAH